MSTHLAPVHNIGDADLYRAHIDRMRHLASVLHGELVRNLDQLDEVQQTSLKGRIERLDQSADELVGRLNALLAAS